MYKKRKIFPMSPRHSTCNKSDQENLQIIPEYLEIIGDLLLLLTNLNVSNLGN